MEIPNPATEWMSVTTWNKLCEYAQKDRDFGVLCANFRDSKKEWKKLFDCETELTDDLFPKNDSSGD
jgi:hypothetical protein